RQLRDLKRAGEDAGLPPQAAYLLGPGEGKSRYFRAFACRRERAVEGRRPNSPAFPGLRQYAATAHDRGRCRRRPALSRGATRRPLLLEKAQRRGAGGPIFRSPGRSYLEDSGNQQGGSDAARRGARGLPKKTS